MIVFPILYVNQAGQSFLVRGGFADALSASQCLMELIDVGGGTRMMLEEHDNRLFFLLLKGSIYFVGLLFIR